MKKGIIAGLISLASFVTGFIIGGKVLVNMINDYKRRMKRNLSNMLLFNDWLEFLYSGGKVEQYFYNHGYKRIMIYGNGYIGKRLQQALEQTDIEVAAVMDKAVSSDERGLVTGIDSSIPDVDCIVITPVYYYDEIFSMLHKKTKLPLVNIQEIINEEHVLNDKN